MASYCVATLGRTTMSGRTSGRHAVDTLVDRCITAVERCAPYPGAIPCSICGARGVESSRDDDGRRQDEETKHDCLPRPRTTEGVLTQALLARPLHS